MCAQNRRASWWSKVLIKQRAKSQRYRTIWEIKIKVSSSGWLNDARKKPEDPWSAGQTTGPPA